MAYTGKRTIEKSKKNYQNNDYNQNYNYEPQETKPSKKPNHKPGFVIMIILAIVVAVFSYLLIKANVLTNTLLYIVFGIIALAYILTGILLWNCRKVGRFVVGVLFALLITAVMTYVSVVILNVFDTYNDISKPTKLSVVGIYVNADDPAENTDDIKAYAFGAVSALDPDNTAKEIDKLEEDLGITIEPKEYESTTDLVDALYGCEVNAIILNEAYVDLLADMDGYEDINDKIREIYEAEIEVVDTPSPEPTETQSPDEVLEDHVIRIYLSGEDSRTGLVAKSKSDSNIIITINTETHQILMVNTPRDFYVLLNRARLNGDTLKDKLTHAGLYGVDESVATLEDLYDVDIDYYFRVNFSGFEEIVDALGGITVDSQYSFTSEDGYTYQKGSNTLNGAQALSFARERHAFSSGDLQRGKNQMAVIKGILNKAMSSAILTKWQSLLESLEGNFETNVPYDLIGEIVQIQLDYGGEWDVMSYAVDGSNGNDKCYTGGGYAYVMIPNDEKVEQATEYMKALEDNQVITVEE